MAWSSVDLPEPLGPMMAVVRPEGMAKVASARATCWPWASVMPSAVTASACERESFSLGCDM